MCSSILQDLFRPMKLMLRTSNLFFQWFAITAIFYGLGFGSADLMGDPFTNFSLTCLMEFPGIAIGFFSFDRVGRRASLVILQLCAGVACLVTGLINQTLYLAAFQTGKQLQYLSNHFFGTALFLPNS